MNCYALTSMNCSVMIDDKNRQGGGVCIWVDHRFSPRKLLPVLPIPSCIELVFIRLSCNEFFILCFALYIPPGLARGDHDHIVNFLTFELDRLVALCPSDRVVIAGDLNDFPTSVLTENFNLTNRLTEATKCRAI